MEELQALSFHFSLQLDETTTLFTAPSFWVLFVVGMLTSSMMNSYFVKSIFCQSEVGLGEKSRYQIEHLRWVATHLVMSPREVISTHSWSQSLCVHGHGNRSKTRPLTPKEILLTSLEMGFWSAAFLGGCVKKWEQDRKFFLGFSEKRCWRAWMKMDRSTIFIYLFKRRESLGNLLMFGLLISYFFLPMNETNLLI